ncbi:MAG TPA: BrnA antitoxin family protein [Terriglobia bacterium]|nr:BrnA antitoxin family protein [Terriglobia bacterium]
MRTLTKKGDPELEALVRLRDEEIDTSDIPEVTDWSKAVIGRFYRPVKEPVTLRLDADIIAWLKSAGPGYQTRINGLLRTAMAGAGTRVRRLKRPPARRRND